VPTYEYACKECDEHLEVHQSFTDEPLTECPACGGRLRKVFGNIAITFKGPGFYKTDSRDGGKKTAKAKDGDGGGTKSEPAASSAEKSSSPEKSSSAEKSSPEKSSSAGTSSSTPAPAAAAS
jgi:putative FmdB family regulatory protein